MGAISDAVNFGSWTRARQWALAVLVAVAGFHGMAVVGVIDPTKTLYASNRLMWGSAAVGGALFGFGMVLASGCGSKTLARIGGGSWKAVVVFFVMGVASFATLKGITAVARSNSVDLLAFSTSAPSLVGTALSAASSPTIAAVAILLLATVLAGALFANQDFRSPSNWLPGALLGVCVAAMWFVTGRLGFVAEHPDTLQEAFMRTNSGRAEGFSFVAPIAHTLDWFMFYSDKSKVLTTGVVAVFGVIVGSAITAVATKSFRWEGFAGAQDTAYHVIGAVLMGVGGVTAVGCTVGQGMSGLSALSYTSFVAVAAIVLGAVAAIRFQTWLIERAA